MASRQAAPCDARCRTSPNCCSTRPRAVRRIPRGARASATREGGGEWRAPKRPSPLRRFPLHRPFRRRARARDALARALQSIRRAAQVRRPSNSGAAAGRGSLHDRCAPDRWAEILCQLRSCRVGAEMTEVGALARSALP
eukprot:8493759-Alexandrium_andersonii.AAC.1